MGEKAVETPSVIQDSCPNQEQPPIRIAIFYPDWASIQAYRNASGIIPMHIPSAPVVPSSTPSSAGHPCMCSPEIIPQRSTPSQACARKCHSVALFSHPPIPLKSHPESTYSEASTSGTTIEVHNRWVGEGGKHTVAKQTIPTPSVTNQTMTVTPIPQGGISGPEANLNIGMDYSGVSSAASVSTLQGELHAGPSTSSMETAVADIHHNVQSDVQDPNERKRKLNREAQHRYRQQKKLKDEEIEQRLNNGKEQNDRIRKELENLRMECGKLASANALLTGRVRRYQGLEATASHYFAGLYSSSITERS